MVWPGARYGRKCLIHEALSWGVPVWGPGVSPALMAAISLVLASRASTRSPPDEHCEIRRFGRLRLHFVALAGTAEGPRFPGTPRDLRFLRRGDRI